MSQIIYIFILYLSSLIKGSKINYMTGRNCDLIVVRPGNYLVEKDFSHDSQEARVLLNAVGNHNFRLTTSKIKCQTVLMSTDDPNDLQLASRVFYQYACTKSKMVIYSNNTGLAMIRLPFNLNIIAPDGRKVSYRPRWDASWRTLKVSWTEFRPYVYQDIDGNIAGIDYDIWGTVAAKLGLNLVFQNKTGSFVQMYMALPYRQAEIALIGTAYLHSMLQMGDPTHFTFLESYRFFNRKPGPVTPLLTLIYPFNRIVWIFVLASFAFATIAIYLINLKTNVDLFTTIQIILSCIVSDTLSSKLLATLNRSWYGFIVLSIWFMCGLLLSAAYSSNLLASLFVVEKQVPDNTIQDLVNHGATLAVPKGSVFYHWMLTSPKPIVQKALQMCVINKNGLYIYNSTGEKLPQHLEKRLEHGEASSSSMESLFYPYYDQRKYRLGKETLMSSFSTYYMQHKHPMKAAIDDVLSWMTDSGTLQHIKDMDLWQEATKARDYERLHNEEDEQRLEKISTSHLSALWILYAIGMIVGLILFAYEMSKSKLIRRSEYLQLEWNPEMESPRYLARPSQVYFSFILREYNNPRAPSIVVI